MSVNMMSIISKLVIVVVVVVRGKKQAQASEFVLPSKLAFSIPQKLNTR